MIILPKGVRYQYMVVPYTPSKQLNVTTSPMGVMAITTSGAPIYNPLSSSDGSLASYYEWTTLDPCYGHSDASYQYHYHAVISHFSKKKTQLFHKYSLSFRYSFES